MKPIKKLHYVILATILTGITQQASAMIAEAPAAKAPAAKTNAISKNVEQLANTRKAEIASRKGAINRSSGAMHDAMFGQPGRRDAITNQKRSLKDSVDSLSLSPETTVSTGTKTLDLSSINSINTKGRTLSDVTSNYVRNLDPLAKNVKITKRAGEHSTEAYKEFTQPGDKIVETWNKNKDKLEQVKIESPDGSYRIIDNTGARGNSQGKIISQRTADGKMIENEYFDNGNIKQSTVTTPRTLNMLESNSMQTRAVTTYNNDGSPASTLTYKESLLGGKTGEIISYKEYDPKNLLQYNVYNTNNPVNKTLLESRTVAQDAHGNTVLTTTSPGGKVREIITLDPQGQPLQIQTFNKHQASARDKSSETVTFNSDGSATKVVTNSAGNEIKTIISKQGGALQIQALTQTTNLFGTPTQQINRVVEFDNQGNKTNIRTEKRDVSGVENKVNSQAVSENIQDASQAISPAPSNNAVSPFNDGTNVTEMATPDQIVTKPTTNTNPPTTGRDYGQSGQNSTFADITKQRVESRNTVTQASQQSKGDTYYF